MDSKKMIERLKTFLAERRSPEELRQVITSIVEKTDDARTLERIWYSAIFFRTYGEISSEKSQAIMQQTGRELMEELLKP